MKMNHLQRVAACIMAEVPGSTVEVGVSPAHRFRLMFNWVYECPCGELSVYREMHDNLPRPVHGVRFSVDLLKEVMRRHVRSEGNEPSF